MVDAAVAAQMLDELLTELSKRRPDVEDLMDAYDGEHPLQFASQNFKEFFDGRYERFSDNWCGVVADAPHERLEITGIRLPGQQDGDDALFADWRRTNSDVLSDLAFLDAIIAKRAFALVWGSANDEPLVTWEHPSQAIVGYDPETRERKAGAKTWADDDNEYATLYLADEVWKFQRPRIRNSLVLVNVAEGTGPILAGGWALRDEGRLPNPMGKVPLVEFANRPRLMREPHSDVKGMLAMQHAINLFWAELFAVADEATIGQRLIIGAEMPVMPVLDAEGNVVAEKKIDLKKWRKDRVGWIEDPTAKAHEWQPAKMDPFTSVIEIMVGHVAAQTRTPAHYLLVGGTMANVSGDALKGLETGLVARTREKAQHFGRAARDVFELMALVRNDVGKASEIRGAEVLWRDIENRSDAQVADAALKDRQIGLPLRYILEKRYNLSPSEIDRVMDMRDSEALDPQIQAILNDPGANPNASPAAVGE